MYNYKRALCKDPKLIQGWFSLVANIKAITLTKRFNYFAKHTSFIIATYRIRFTSFVIQYLSSTSYTRIVITFLCFMIDLFATFGILQLHTYPCYYLMFTMIYFRIAKIIHLTCLLHVLLLSHILLQKALILIAITKIAMLFFIINMCNFFAMYLTFLKSYCTKN